jgi:hypothetical protein
MSVVLKKTLFIDSYVGIQWLGSERFALGFSPDWAHGFAEGRIA